MEQSSPTMKKKVDPLLEASVQGAGICSQGHREADREQGKQSARIQAGIEHAMSEIIGGDSTALEVEPGSSRSERNAQNVTGNSGSKDARMVWNQDLTSFQKNEDSGALEEQEEVSAEDLRFMRMAMRLAQRSGEDGEVPVRRVTRQFRDFRNDHLHSVTISF